MIPKLSAPLVKDIRTGEGILEWALGVGVTVLTAVGDLGVGKGTVLLTILAGLKGVRRGLLKVVSLQKYIGVDAPLEPQLLHSITAEVGTVAGQVGSGLTQPPLPPQVTP